MKETGIKKGFAAMDLSRRRAIASMGGRRAHELGVAHKFTSEQARENGRKGGAAVALVEGHMAAIGRRGGVASGRSRAEKRRAREAGHGLGA